METKPLFTIYKTIDVDDKCYMKLSTLVSRVGHIVKRAILNEGYCPCRGTYIDEFKCPCKECREEGKCDCGLYVRVEKCTK